MRTAMPLNSLVFNFSLGPRDATGTILRVLLLTTLFAGP